MTGHLSLAEARRIALAAQGFAQARPRSIDRGTLRRTVERLGVVQIDSVNVVTRSHFLPFFSRLGPYDPVLLERAAYARDRVLFEYWAHEASLVPLALQPLLRWRMARAQRGSGTYGRVAETVRTRRSELDRVLAIIRERGALSAGELEGGKGRGSWWGWSDIKLDLETLFWCGEVTTRTRRGFERVYDLPERVFPAAIVNAPTPAEDDAQRELVRIAARACGIAAERDLRDYFRLDLADARQRVAELVDCGELLAVAVEGLRGPRYLWHQARVPRRIEAQAILSPFDSVVWERARTRELYEFDFRLEIYTPAHKRVHGYYVLPFLLGDRLTARLDLKHDRTASTLLVHAVHIEPWTSRRAIAGPLRDELRALADFLGAEKVRMPR